MKSITVPPDWAVPKNEEQRVAQIVLSVIKNYDKLETIDWQIARAVIADRKSRRRRMKCRHCGRITERGR